MGSYDDMYVGSPYDYTTNSSKCSPLTTDDMKIAYNSLGYEMPDIKQSHLEGLRIEIDTLLKDVLQI